MLSETESSGDGRCWRRAAQLRPALVLLASSGLLSMIPTVAIGGQSGGEPETSRRTSTPVVASEEAPEDQGLMYLRAAASSFTPYDSSTTWVYEGSGCRSLRSGSPWFDLGVEFPDGAIIDFLRVYFYDADAVNDVSAVLYGFDNEGDQMIVAQAAGSGTPGFSSAGSGLFSHTVDNVAQSMVVRIDLDGGSDDTLWVCGVRIRYFKAEIFADGFEGGDTSAWSTTRP